MAADVGSFQLAHRRVVVRRVVSDALPDGHFGRYSPLTGVIEVRFDLPGALALEVFLHEVVHAGFDAFGHHGLGQGKRYTEEGVAFAAGSIFAAAALDAGYRRIYDNFVKLAGGSGR